MSLMTARSQLYNVLKNVRYLSLSQGRSDNVVVFEKSGSKQQAPASGGDVPGLSTEVVDYGTEPVGSGASKCTGYKNPEYFSYHKDSYYNAEVEMVKYRNPQPDSRKKATI